MTPLYSDTPRFSLFTVVQPVIAGVLLFLGVTGDGAFGILVGLALGFYYLYATHTRYDLSQDALVIRYRIRTIVVPLSDVQDAQLLKMPRQTRRTGAGTLAEDPTELTNKGLVIKRRAGGDLIITPKDPEGFLSRLEAGLRTSEEPPQP